MKMQMKMGLGTLPIAFGGSIPTDISLINDQSTLQTTNITLAGLTGTLDWGDESGVAVTAGEQTYSHDYSTEGSYNIAIDGDLENITKIDIADQVFISGSISFMPLLTSLITSYLYLTSLTGGISSFKNMSSLRDIQIHNSNIRGDLISIASLTLNNLIANSSQVSFSSGNMNFLAGNVNVKDNEWGASEVDEFIMGVARKEFLETAFYCDSSGDLSIPSTQVDGVWRYDTQQRGSGKSDYTRFQFISSANADHTASQGYMIDINKSEAIRLIRYDNGAETTLFVTANGYCPRDVWVTFEIERIGGIISVKMNGVLITPSSGSNPIEDTTFNISAYVYMDWYSANRIKAVILDGVDVTGSINILSGSWTVYRTEYIQNGGFENWAGSFPNETPDDWSSTGVSVTNYITQVDNACRMVSDGTYIHIAQVAIPLEVGEVYEYSILILELPLGSIRFQIGDGETATYIVFTSTGLHTGRFAATDTDFRVVREAGACDATFTNVSAKKYAYNPSSGINLLIDGSNAYPDPDLVLPAVTAIEAASGNVVYNLLESFVITNDQSILQQTLITIDTTRSDMTIDWGDNNVDIVTTGEAVYVHDYSIEGAYDITIVGNLKAVLKFTTNNSCLSGVGAGFGKMIHLVYLDLDSTAFSGNSSDYIGSEIEVLNISNSLIVMQLDLLGSMELKGLYFSSTTISGSISALSTQTELTHLDISHITTANFNIEIFNPLSKLVLFVATSLGSSLDLEMTGGYPQLDGADVYLDDNDWPATWVDFWINAIAATGALNYDLTIDGVSNSARSSASDAGVVTIETNGGSVIANDYKIIELVNDQSVLAETRFICNGAAGKIFWGDGNETELSATANDVTHNYGVEGSYDITISLERATLVHFEMTDQPFISGDISQLNIFAFGLTYSTRKIDVSNTQIYGSSLDIANLIHLTDIDFSGSDVTYATGTYPQWNNATFRFYDSGLLTADIDAIVIDLAATTPTGLDIIVDGASNEVRSIASNNAAASIIENSGSVVANETFNVLLSNDQSTLQTTNITLAGVEGTIYWGDTNETVVTAAEDTYSHDYAGIGTYEIAIVSNDVNITKLEITHDFIGGDLTLLVVHLVNMVHIILNTCDVIFDISDLNVMSNIETIELASTSVTGSFDSLSDALPIHIFNVRDTAVEGNIQTLQNITSFTYVDVSDCADVYGAAGWFLATSAKPNLTYFDISNVYYASWNVSGADIVKPANAIWKTSNAEMNTIGVDGCIEAAATLSPVNMTLIVDGASNDERTSASNAAVDIIEAGGGSVTANEPTILLFTNDQVSGGLQTTNITLVGSTGVILWGDGDETVVTAGEQIYSHDYNNTNNYIISITKSYEITKLSITHDFIGGDITTLRSMSVVEEIYLQGSAVTGDITHLSGLTSITTLYLFNTAVTGDVNDLSTLINMVTLSIGNTSIVGDIADLNTIYNESLTAGYLFSLSLTYTDLSTFDIPSFGKLYAQDSGLTSAMVDNILVDLAAGSASSGTIRLDGTNEARTSASDAAVATLLGRSWLVTVNEPSYPVILDDGNTKIWLEADSGITIETGVSAWKDARGGAYPEIVQADTTKQPAWSEGGVTFDGVNDDLKAAFTLNRPEQIYCVFKQVTWGTHGDKIFDGSANSTGYFQQSSSSPGLATGPEFINCVGELPIGNIQILRCRMHYQDSVHPGVARGWNRLDEDTRQDDASTSTPMAGLTLGSLANETQNFSNVQIQAIIIRTVDEDPDDEIAIYEYLRDKWNPPITQIHNGDFATGDLEGWDTGIAGWNYSAQYLPRHTVKKDNYETLEWGQTEEWKIDWDPAGGNYELDYTIAFNGGSQAIYLYAGGVDTGVTLAGTNTDHTSAFTVPPGTARGISFVGHPAARYTFLTNFVLRKV